MEPIEQYIQCFPQPLPSITSQVRTDRPTVLFHRIFHCISLCLDEGGAALPSHTQLSRRTEDHSTVQESASNGDQNSAWVPFGKPTQLPQSSVLALTHYAHLFLNEIQTRPVNIKPTARPAGLPVMKIHFMLHSHLCECLSIVFLEDYLLIDTAHGVLHLFP